MLNSNSTRKYSNNKPTKVRENNDTFNPEPSLAPSERTLRHFLYFRDSYEFQLQSHSTSWRFRCQRRENFLIFSILMMLLLFVCWYTISNELTVCSPDSIKGEHFKLVDIRAAVFAGSVAFHT